VGNEYLPTNPNGTEDLHCSTGPENPDWVTKSYCCVLLVLAEEWGTKTAAYSCTFVAAVAVVADFALDDQSQMSLLGDCIDVDELHLASPPNEWEMSAAALTSI